MKSKPNRATTRAWPSCHSLEETNALRFFLKQVTRGSLCEPLKSNLRKKHISPDAKIPREAGQFEAISQNSGQFDAVFPFFFEVTFSDPFLPRTRRFLGLFFEKKKTGLNRPFYKVNSRCWPAGLKIFLSCKLLTATLSCKKYFHY